MEARYATARQEKEKSCKATGAARYVRENHRSLHANSRASQPHEMSGWRWI